MLLLEDGRLVSELMRRKCGRVLRLHSKRVLVGEMVLGAKGMRVEAVELRGRCGLPGMQASF
jgi:hypothetical protein